MRDKVRRANGAAGCGMELVDLAQDPGEPTNLADANPDVVTKLTARMREPDAEIAQNSRQS